MWPHIKEFYKSPGSEEDSKGDNNDKTGETEPVKVYICYKRSYIWLTNFNTVLSLYNTMFGFHRNGPRVQAGA